ncbi:MAG: hypothetical protein PHE33_12140, partial [Bacteroidales bacterium]|nr:hypothetical protein [Bacteroidales bacterium]
MKKSLVLFFGYLLLFTFGAFSQVVVSFNAPVPNPCAPVNINFTNTSTGCSGTETYSWVCTGVGFSELENPTFTFSSGGVYTVKFTLTCDGIPYVETTEITIYDSPTASFDDTQLKGCVPYTANFTDQSTQGDGIIENWQWFFGDGNSSTLRNPSNLYEIGR